MGFITFIKAVAPYIKYVIFAAAIITLTVLFINKSKQVNELNAAMDLYKRQMSGQLTEKEQQFQAANQSLGIAQSKLLKQSDLADQYKKDGIAASAEFEAYKKKYNVELQSYQRTIAQLQQQLKNGTTVVNATDPRLSTDPKPDSQFNKPIDPAASKLSYSWNSGDGRFALDDQDVFTKNNETFTLHQNFRITGEVFRERTGFLQTSRLILEEVVPDGSNSDGSPKYKTVNTAKVIDSQFKYTADSPDKWVPRKGVFGVWGIVTGSIGFNNGLNPRFMLGTGLEFLQVKGLGVGLQLYLDVNQWKESGFGFSLSYRPTIRGTQLNLGITAGLATQFQQPFKSYIPMAGLVFYLW